MIPDGTLLDTTIFEKPMHFKGLRTAIYHVGDIELGKAWYIKALDIQPYFDQPFYVGFNVGGFELGLDSDSSSSSENSQGVTTYWGVEDIASVLEHLLAIGASEHEGIQDVGEGILVASVRDPFGNILGIIENPHFEISGN